MKIKKCSSKESMVFDTTACAVLIVSEDENIISCIKKELSHFNVTVIGEFKEQSALSLQTFFEYAIVDDAYHKESKRFEVCAELLKLNNNMKLLFLSEVIDEISTYELLEYNVIEFIQKDELLEYKLNGLEKTICDFEKSKATSVVLCTQNKHMAESFELFVKPFEYDLCVVYTNDELLMQLEKNRHELLLYDLDDAQSSAFEFLKQQQNYFQETLELTVLAISSKVCSSTQQVALKLGLADLVVFPFDINSLFHTLRKNILNQQNKHELLCSTQLLKQYKETVDRSSIVSKTDPTGRITYVNEAFCKISGYTQEELIGKSHNIVRHPDMDSAVFTYMWHTIKELKQPWVGQVKNRKKNGGEYWVQTVINPIIDVKGEVVEYIGIRTDITDIENTKKYLREQFSITEDKFIEVMNLSKLYEGAINQTNIIIRANLNRKITYANDLFYKISGYTPEELIGKPYEYIRRHPDTTNEDIESMWATIESGQTWRGKLKNISKNGEPYYSIATVVPIKNSKDEILEYMSIRQDITELVLLHEEIEQTQREIVYKMGEIGETRSKETGNHVKRVATYSKLLAQLYGLSDEEADTLFTASPMHDIGKVGIPDAVLNKPARLNEDEWKVMKTHAVIGYNILKTSKRKVLQAAAIVARDHHEKWDGSGYPKKRKGEEIHIFGRITAVADVFDALGSDRCYKKAWEDEKIIQLFKDERGKHFEPKLIDLFLENLDAFYAIRKRYQD